MNFLVAALVAAAISVPPLWRARVLSGREGGTENIGLWLLFAVFFASFAFGAIVPLLALAVFDVFAERGVSFDFTSSLWRAVLSGLVFGLALFCNGLFIQRVSGLARTWCCREPWETTRELELREVLAWLLGFVCYGVLVGFGAYLLKDVPSNLAVYLLAPPLVSLYFMYLWLIHPWIVYGRAPRFSSRNLEHLEAWLEELRKRLGVSSVQLRIHDGGYCNAMAMAGPRGHFIVLGSGLIDNLTQDQLRVVLAHELSHVRGRDLLRMLGWLTLCGFGLVLWRLHVVEVLFSSVVAKAATVAVGALLFLGLLPGLLGRGREYAADRGAVELTGDRELVIDTLKRLRKLGMGWGWSHTHPSTSARIRAIQALPTDAGRPSD